MFLWFISPKRCAGFTNTTALALGVLHDGISVAEDRGGQKHLPSPWQSHGHWAFRVQGDGVRNISPPSPDPASPLGLQGLGKGGSIPFYGPCPVQCTLGLQDPWRRNIPLAPHPDSPAGFLSVGWGEKTLRVSHTIKLLQNSVANRNEKEIAIQPSHTKPMPESYHQNFNKHELQ